MEKAYKYRIYPNEPQKKLIQKTFGCTRYVYNYYLSLRKEVYENEKRTMNYNLCSANLTRLKRDFDWLCEVDATALQSALKNLDGAFQNFFRGLKKKRRVGYPKFKSKRNNYRSYKSKMSGNNIKVTDVAIRLPKLGFVKAEISRPIEGRILSATVTQVPSGKYFASICCTNVEIEHKEKTGAVVGIDLGIKDFAILSDETKYDSNKFLRKSEKKVKRLQRSMSRKQRGSRNREKSRMRLAVAHERITNQRNDFLHKTSSALISDYDVICVETLAPSNMVRNHELAHSISDASWGEFIRQLEYKAKWRGKIVQKISQFFPSSQTCNVCGEKNKRMKDLSVRQWTCAKCGTHHDRDVNAARNILNEGLRLLSE